MNIILIERLETPESQAEYENKQAFIKERDAKTDQDWAEGRLSVDHSSSKEAIDFAKETRELQEKALQARDFSNGRLIAKLEDMAFNAPLPTSGLSHTITVDGQAYLVAETDYVYKNSPIWAGGRYVDVYKLDTIYYGVVPCTGSLDYRYPFMPAINCNCKWPALHELNLVEE